MPKPNSNRDEYSYRQDGDRITVSHVCEDGTIVPGPHPHAFIDFGKATMGVTAHGVDKLDAAMREYAGGHWLTDDAKAFLHELLARVTCPPIE